MTEAAPHGAGVREPVGALVLAAALVLGSVLGVTAKLLGGAPGPLALLGAGAAIWVTAGFLLARGAARGRDALDGTVWAGTTFAVYLSGWLLAYCFAFGLQDPAGFGAAWLNERLFFIISPVASALFGAIAAASERRGWLGDACLAAPIAWSLPESGYAFAQGWQFAIAAALPTLALAFVPAALGRGRHVNRRVFVTVCVAGAVLAYALIHVTMGRF